MRTIQVPGYGPVKFPENMSDSDIALAIERDILPTLPPPAPPTTFGGNVKEFVKGIPAGFVGTFGTAAEGLASLLPEETEKAVVGKTRSIVDALSPDAALGYEDSIGRNLGQAFGSIGSFIIPGGAVTAGAKALGAGAKGLTAARLGTVGTLGGAAGAGEARQRAEVEGATPEEKASATALGVLPGLLEIIPAERILGRLFKPAEAVLDAVPDAMKSGMVSRIREIAKTAGIEAAQEAAQGLAQNLIAQGVYKPDQELLEGLGEQAAYGGAAGAMAEAILGLALGRKATQTRNAIEQKAKEEERTRLAAEADKGVAAEFGAPLLTGEEATRDLFATEEGGAAPFSRLETGDEKEVGEAQAEDTARSMQREYSVLKMELQRLQQEAADAADKDDFDGAARASTQYKQFSEALTSLEKQAKAAKVPLQAPETEPADKLQARLDRNDVESKINSARAALKKAAMLGETAKVSTLGQKIKDLQQQMSAATPDLFSPENIKRTFDINFAPFAERQDLLAASLRQPPASEQRQDAQIKTFMQQMEDLQEESRQLKQSEELSAAQIAEAQGQALNRIEFGLQRMGLTALGITGRQREVAEKQINQGLLAPEVAAALEIVPADIDAQIAEAKKRNDAPALRRLQTLKLEKPTKASDILAVLEEKYNEIEQRRKDLLYSYLNDEVAFLDANGQLTDAGKQAVQDEVRLRELGILRFIGAEAGKPTKESVAAAKAAERKKFELESAQGADTFGAAVTQGAGPIEGVEQEEQPAPIANRNEAFVALSDAAYALQRGQFLGTRTAAQGVPSYERERSEKLQKQIDKVQDDLKLLRGRQSRGGKQPSEAAQRRISQLEGRLKTLRAGISSAAAEGRTLYSTLVKRAETAANYMVESSVKEVNADRVARRLPEMTNEEELALRLKLDTEVKRFVSRVSAAERTTGEQEKKPVGVKMVDGKPVVVEKMAPKAPPIEQRPYEKLNVALNTLRNTVEDTVTEAKGKPLRGEVKPEPVEKVEKAPEKAPTPKTTAEKGKVRAAQASAEAAAKRIELAKQIISKNQREIGLVEVEGGPPSLTEQLRKAGAEAAALKKAAANDKNPQLRLAKVARIEESMAVVRERIKLLKGINSQLSAMLNKFGVDTKRVQSGEAILNQIENDLGIPTTPVADKAEVERNQARLDKNRKDRKAAQERMSDLSRENNKLARKAKLQLGADKTRSLNKIKANKLEIDKIKDSVSAFDKRIAQGVGFVVTEVKAQAPAPRFTPYQLDLAVKALNVRIEQTLARMEKTEGASLELSTAVKAQLGLGLPGTRVTVKQVPSLIRRGEDKVAAEEKVIEAQIAEAEAARDAIKDANLKAKKPVRSPEWYAANGKVMRLKKALKAVPEFETGFIPVRTKTELFASPNLAKDVTGRRSRETADFVMSKPEDAEDTAAELLSVRKEMLGLAKQDLAKAQGDAAVSKAKKQVKYWENRVSEAVVFKRRSELTEKELLEGSDQNQVDIETDFDAGSATDADIINSIDYRDDTIDPAFGEEATEMIDEAAAKKRLDDVKAKAKARDIEFEYYDSVEKLPIGILKQMAKQGMDTSASQLKGGVHKGKVFVIVKNHNNLKDLEETLAHELIGHYAFDGLLGESGMKSLLRSIDKSTGGLDKLAADLDLTDTVNSVFIDTVNYYGQAFKEGKITEAEIRERAKMKAMREMVAYTMQKRVDEKFKQKAGRWIKELVGAVRAAFRSLGMDFKDITTSDLFYLMRKANNHFESGKPIASRNDDGTISFRTAATTAPAGGFDSMIAQRGTALDKVKANVSGLNFRVQFLDRLAALDALVKRGVEKGIINSLKAYDVLYFSRMADQRNNFVAQFATNGVGKLTEKNGERMYGAGSGPSLKDVSRALNGSGVPDSILEAEFTKYLVALRAKRVGVDKLDFTGTRVTPADVNAIIAKYSGKDPASVAFNKAKDLYQQYNANLIDFVVSTGAMSAEKGAELKKHKDYVPFYRNVNGEAQLIVFGEKPIRIGDMKNQPYLQELVGGETQIMPVFTGALQNTSLLTDMALKNMATRNAAYVMQDLGVAKVREGAGPANANVIRFKRDGKDFYAVVDTAAQEAMFGDIPTNLVVQGMEGIRATVPAAIRLMGLPADWLRSFVTRDPRYAIRQIFRDSLAAVMTTGADFKPVLGTLNDLVKMNARGDIAKLQASGVIGGQVVSGMSSDMEKILFQLASGKPGWQQAMAKLDQFAMMGDAATRVSMYNSFIKQGLSDREATLATLEAMNFSRRGLSPSMLYANMLIPFFNAGIQGIDVIYRAIKGDMPESQRLKVRQKLIARGVTMAALTMAYAAIMDDDETYENANSEERYSNWFVPTPLGTFKVPIPFELGLIFKSLPEGVVRAAMSDETAGDVAKALGRQAMLSVPLSVPTAIKPMIETYMNKSFFTGRDIVPKNLQGLSADLQVGINTPELIKLAGEFGVPPLHVENILRGYTGSLLVGLLRVADPVLSSGPAKPTMRITDTPVFGSMFQPPDAGGTINRAFEAVEKAQGVSQTYKRLAESDPVEANKFLQENIAAFSTASMGGSFRQQIGQIAKAERFVRDSRTLTPDEKRQKLDAYKDIKIQMAKNFNAARAQIERRASQP